MNRTHRRQMMVVASSLCAVLCRSASAREDGAQALETLNHALDAGLPSFIARVRADKLAPPLIHSNWYVTELEKTRPDEAAVQRKERQFGRKVVELLDAASDDILVLTDSPSREQAATALLDLADWIAGQRGYGNMLIFDRCQDMATVPVAHLIADLSYPQPRLDAKMARFVSWVDELRMCAEALNTEAPEPIFVPGRGATLLEVQWPVQRAWAKQVNRVAEWRQQNGVGSGIALGSKDRSTLPHDMAFFCDDFFPSDRQPTTTLNQWDCKIHEHLVVGMGSKNLELIQYFLLFRKKVGYFPTKPPAWWKPGRKTFPTPESAAFDQAWEPFRSPSGPSGYGSAPRVYTAVKSNTFLDQDTQDKRLHEVKELAAAGGIEVGPDGRVRTRDSRLRLGPDGEITLVGPASGSPATQPTRWSAWILVPASRPATPSTTRPTTVSAKP